MHDAFKEVNKGRFFSFKLQMFIQMLNDFENYKFKVVNYYVR